MGAAVSPQPPQTHPFANLGLNVPEKVLQGAHKIETLIEQILDPNVNADAVQDDPSNLHAGILGDIAAEFGDGTVTQDLKTMMDILKTKLSSPLVDDKTYLVSPSQAFYLDICLSQLFRVRWRELLHLPQDYQQTQKTRTN